MPEIFLVSLALSRIDLTLVTSAMLPIISEVTYAARGLSDHPPLALKLTLCSAQIWTLWKVNPYWFDLFPSKENILLEISAYGFFNKPSVSLQK